MFAHLFTLSVSLFLTYMYLGMLMVLVLALLWLLQLLMRGAGTPPPVSAVDAPTDKLEDRSALATVVPRQRDELPTQTDLPPVPPLPSPAAESARRPPPLSREARESPTRPLEPDLDEQGFPEGANIGFYPSAEDDSDDPTMHMVGWSGRANLDALGRPQNLATQSNDDPEDPV